MPVILAPFDLQRSAAQKNLHLAPAKPRRNRRRGGYRSGFRNGKKPENAGKPSEE